MNTTCIKGWIRCALIAWAGIVASVGVVRATEYFVASDGDDGADGLSWATALASPQAALNIATSAGDIVTVSDGLYVLDRGGAAASTAILGLDIDQGITLRSVNGPDVTIIEGNVDSATRIRLARISHADALVEGFTFQGGVVRHEADCPGVTISAGTIRNCVIQRCATYVGDATIALSMSGTAVAERLTIHQNAGSRLNSVVLINDAHAIFRNSLVTDNYVGKASSFYGGPTMLNSARAVQLNNGTIAHCTIAGNFSAPGYIGTGLRMSGGTVSNSIVYHNRDRSLPYSDAFTDVNVVKSGGTISYSIMTPLLAGTGNLDAEPQFVNLARGSWASTGNGTSPGIAIGDYRLGPGSPAIDAATNLLVAVDRNGNARPAGTQPDIGAYEASAPNVGALRVSFGVTNLVTVGPGAATFKAHVSGVDTTGLAFNWDFGNGQTAASGTEHTVAFDAVGIYTARVEVSNSGSETAAWSNIVYRAPATVYAAESGSSEFPFDTPAKGTPVLQHAIAAAAVTASDTSTVAVTAGTYTLNSYQTLQLHKPIRMRGERPDVSILNPQAKCRALEIWDSGAICEGLTITNGYQQTLISSVAGGVLMNGGLLRDCWVVGNLAGVMGGGGIAMRGGLVDRCRIVDNVAARHGSGVYMSGGTLRNSLIAQSYSSGEYEGSTVYAGSGSSVENCTVVDNLNNVPATSPRYFNTGGVLARAGSIVVNTIAWYNLNDAAAGDLIADGLVTHSAAPELVHDPEGTGNLSNLDEPGFVNRGAGNYRLLETSPCVNAGTILAWMMPGSLDLSGVRRVARVPDMGAYEYQPPAGILFMIR